MIIRNDLITEATLGSTVTDVDAQTYLTRIMNFESIPALKAAAINNFFVSLKEANLFTKILAMYPMIGTLPESHVLEAAGRTKLNGQFLDITAKAGYTLTGDSNGLNGRLNDYAATIPDTDSLLFPSATNNHIAVYSRSTTNSVVYYASSANVNQLYGGYDVIGAGTEDMGYVSGGNPNSTWATMSSPDGFWYGQRDGDNISISRSGIRLNTENKPGGTLGNQMRLGYSENVAAKFCFLSFGGCMTIAEELTFYNIVQTLQTNLGRNV